MAMSETGNQSGPADHGTGGVRFPADRLGVAGGFTAAAIFILGALVLYWSSLQAPFLFDDLYLVFRSKSILSLANLPKMLHHNRPLVILTYALNYALDGYRPFGYHLFQVVLHGLNAFLVFVLALLLLRETPRPAFRPGVLWWGVAAGGIFLANPLLSMAVILVSARSELLCAFFYLLGLVLFLRHLSRPGRFSWLGVGVAYLGGILSKEMAITFPAACLVLHLLLSRRNIRASLRENWRLYALLGVVTLTLLIKVFEFNWGETVGGAHLPFTRWEYLFTQVVLLARYIGVFVLPLPAWLCADWDFPVVRHLLDPRLLASGAFWLIAAGGLWLAWRRRWTVVLFAGVMYPVASAPTSSVIPIADPLMEYRVYVPAIFLALIAGALGAALQTGRLARQPRGRWLTAAAVVLVTVWIGLNSILLGQRQAVYRSAEVFWTDAARKSPHKPRPIYNLAVIHFRSGQLQEAIAGFQAVLRLEPDNIDALCQLGDLYRDEGDARTAMRMYLQAQRLKPRSHAIINKICYLWIQEGEYGQAFEQLARFPDSSKDVGYYMNFAVYFARTGRLTEAQSMYRYILQLEPHNAVAWGNLGNLYRRTGDRVRAENCYRKSLSIEPAYYLANYNLGVLYVEEGRLDAAWNALEAARRGNPRFPFVDFEEGNLLATSRRYAQAEKLYRRFLSLRPDHAEGWYRLGLVLRELGRSREADDCFRQVLRLAPNHPARDQIMSWLNAR
jgi:tetratricopeptide (TPR) repeat protein